MLSTINIKEKYDLLSVTYDRKVSVMELLFLKKLRKSLLHHAQGNVLEIGIGTGRNLRYYQNSCKITGVDLSSEMLRRAEKKARTQKKNIQLSLANAEKLPFKNQEFDTVIDTLCLCTYQDPIKVLQEMKRVCKKNGKILLLEHGTSNRKWIMSLQNKKNKKHLEKYCCHLNRDPIKLVTQAKLQPEKIKRSFFGIFYSMIIKP